MVSVSGVGMEETLSKYPLAGCVLLSSGSGVSLGLSPALLPLC